jgi:kynurenine formamidase
MIYVLKNAFPKELISEIKEKINIVESNNKFNSTYNREGKTVNISNTESLKDLDKKISNFVTDFCFNFVNVKFNPSFQIADSGYEYHKYEIGDKCGVHSDNEIAFANNQNSSLIRFATMIVHLNTIEEGGETVFPAQEKTIKTEEGQIVLFPPYGNYPHYVTSSNQERAILMTWFVYSGINAIRV